MVTDHASETMQPNKAYDEVIEFIASSSPQNVVAFRLSEEAKARVADLIFREKTEGLPDDENSPALGVNARLAFDEADAGQASDLCQTTEGRLSKRSIHGLFFQEFC